MDPSRLVSVLQRLKRDYLCLLVHDAAVILILVGWGHLVHVDSDQGQDVFQLLHGLLGQSGLSAQDPSVLSAGLAVGAAVDQGVTLIVCGQHPVGSRRFWERDDYESENCWNITQATTQMK